MSKEYSAETGEYSAKREDNRQFRWIRNERTDYLQDLTAQKSQFRPAGIV